MDNLKLNTKSKTLLDIEFPDDLQQIWTEEVAEKLELHEEESISLVIFGIGEQWFGLDVQEFKDVVADSPVHSIPGKSNSFIEGLVNIEGELLIKINPREILGIEDKTTNSTLHKLILLENDNEQYVIEADEFLGVIKLNPASITKSPALNIFEFQKALNELNNKSLMPKIENHTQPEDSTTIESDENIKSTVIMGIFKPDKSKQQVAVNLRETSKNKETIIGIIWANKFFETFKKNLNNR